jgi:hypothetical protein
MRKWLFLMGLYAASGLQAQTKLYVVAGMSSDALATLPADEQKNNRGYAWQAGVSAEFIIKGKGFLYSGLLYETKRIDRKYHSCCFYGGEETLSLQYLSLPLGAGFRLPVGNSVQLAFSGGAYISYGLGGILEGVNTSGDYEPYRPVHYKYSINFGSSNRDDMLRWNWGLQAGVSVSRKKFIAQFSYNHGISNLTRANFRTTSGYLSQKYRVMNLSLGYRLFSFQK